VIVVGVEPRWSLFALPPAPIAGRVGILVQSQRRGGPPDAADWSTITRIGEVPRSQKGDLVEGYRLYRVTGRDGATPAAVMPRP
jgi:hypothetical protein